MTAGQKYLPESVKGRHTQLASVLGYLLILAIFNEYVP